MKTNRKAAYTLLAALVFAPFASAQVPAAIAEDVTTLSPFTVTASGDQGYRATNTLAGTRLRTDLKDLGTSIQVLTKDFMDDLGATNAQELLTYTTNTEIAGIGGNFSGADLGTITYTGESRAEPQSASRVRGLFKADLTRGYYKTLIPFDSYNSNRVDINRGSNATLYGLGSPAGIVNNTLDEAQFKNRGEVSTRFDSEGSVRAALELNRVLIKDKLAVNLALLRDDTKYKQQPAFEDTKRGYANLKWRVFPTTTFKANYEHGEINANRPDAIGPRENISTWFLAGKPIIDQRLSTGMLFDAPVSAGGLGGHSGIFVDLDNNPNTPLQEARPENITAATYATYMQHADGGFYAAGKWGVNASKILTATNPLFGNGSTANIGILIPRLFNYGTIVYGDRNSASPSLTGFIGQFAANNNVAGDALARLGDGLKETHQFVSVRNLDEYYPNYNRQGFVDNRIYDFAHNLLGGSISFQNTDFDAANFAVEQTFADNQLGVELAYDKQTYNNHSYAPIQSQQADIYVDINTLLPDGRLNPNFGRPFVEANANNTIKRVKFETRRATAFARHDFAQQFRSGLGRWLGKHVLTGLLERSEEEKLSYGQRLAWYDADLNRMQGVTNDLTNNTARTVPLLYVGPSMLNARSFNDIVIDGIGHNVNIWTPGSTAKLTFWDPGANAQNPAVNNTQAAAIVQNGKLVTKDIPLVNAITGADLQRSVTKSQAAVLQSHLLDGSIVTTVGYRRDRFETDSITNAPTDALGIQIPSRLDADGQHNRWSDTASRWSKGVVAHWPRQWKLLPKGTELSVHYAQSSNNQVGATRVSWNNDVLPDVEGITEERGFALSLFDGKLNARINWYKTEMKNLDSSYFLGQPVFNDHLQDSDSKYSAAVTESDPLFKAFERAIADTMIGNLTAGQKTAYGVIVTKGPDGAPNGVTYGAPVSPKDTEDLTAKGVELEITYNPTKNWRIFANIAQQNTVRSNMLPLHKSEYLPAIDASFATPIPGFEFITLGEVPRGQISPDSFSLDMANKTFGLKNSANPRNYISPNSRYADSLINYRTALASEGAKSNEQREWRFNVVTNYSFSEGRLKGVGVGGAYRWQDTVAIGFPYVLNADGQTVGDVLHPVYGPAEGNLDLFTSYVMPYFRKYGKWKLQLNVRNVLAKANEVIPLQVQGGQAGVFARVRTAPQRLFIFSSTFSF